MECFGRLSSNGYGALGVTRRLEELSGNDEDEDDGGGKPGGPTLPEEEPLLGRLHLTGGMGEGFIELEGLSF